MQFEESHAFFCKLIVSNHSNCQLCSNTQRMGTALDHTGTTCYYRSCGTISQPLAAGWKNDETAVDRLPGSRHDEDERLRTRDVAHPET